MYNLQQGQHIYCIFQTLRDSGKIQPQVSRLYSHSVDRTTGLICDQSVLLNGFYQAKDYPDKLRQVKYYYAEHDRTLGSLSNN